MVNKMTFLAGVGIGYVLGTKAGREKFDQMTNQTRNMLTSPTAQNAKETAKSQATRLYDGGKHVASDQMQKRRHDSATGADALASEG